MKSGELLRNRQSTTRCAREHFITFVVRCCQPLLSTNSIYFVLCGRVGLRPENLVSDLVGSPMCFVRVNLNPIRPPYIRQILDKTKIGVSVNAPTFTEWIQSRNQSPDELCEKLYVETCGHPRSIQNILEHMVSKNNPRLLNDGTINLLVKVSDVESVLTQYPRGVKVLYDAATNNEKIDL